MNVKIYNASGNPMPQYKTPQSAGMDLAAFISEKLEIMPGETALIGTGIYIELPNGYEAQVRTRSGLALKYGLVVLNSPGTIDADYRGEVKVILHNTSKFVRTIENGDRIAQMVFARVEQAIVTRCESLEELTATERGSGGFGHTGVK